MQTRRRGIALVVMGLALLTAAAAPAGSDLKFSLDLRPRFNVPRTATRPEIDGVLGEEEWRQAVVLRGTTKPNNPHLVGRRVSFRLAWDRSHLYIGARSSIREGEVLIKNLREPRSLGVVFDDAYEFGLDLRGANQGPNEAPFFFKFILNALGAGEYQKIYPTIGQSIYNWNPDMAIGNRVWEDESGQRWWDMELALDLDDLQMPRPLQAGDTLGVLLARDFKAPWLFTNIPSATGFLVSRGFPVATLVEGEPYLRLEKLDGLLDGRVDLQARLRNPGAQPAEVAVSLLVRSHGPKNQEGTELLLREERTLALPAGGEELFAVARKLPEPDGFLHLVARRVGAAEEAAALFEYHVGFREDKEKAFLTYKRTVPDFPLAVRFNPVSRKLWLSGDTLDAKLADRDAAVAMTYRVSGEDGPVAEVRIERYSHYKFMDVVALPAIAPGEYAVRCALVDADGAELLADTKTIEEGDEAAAFAEWWDNDIGDPDQLLRPFEPLRVEADRQGVAVRPVLRAYHLDVLGLPRAITSNDGQVLRGPARLVVAVNGREHAVPVAGRLEVVDAEEYRVRFRGEATAAGLHFATAGSVEQDGLVDIELTYRPLGEPVEVQELRLEWPVDDALGNHMVVIGAGGNYAVRSIGRVPAGDGVVWDSLHNLGLQGSMMTAGNFYGNVWIGTERRGLLWAGDSDEGWVPKATVAAHSLLRRDGAVVIRNHLIGTAPGEAPFRLDHARTVRFQYNASPFKPLEPGFRVNLRSAGNGFGSKPGYMLNPETKLDGWTLLHPPTPNKEEWSAWYARWQEHAGRLNREGLYDVGRRQKDWNNTQIALRGYGKKSIEPGIYPYFAADWLPMGRGDELLTRSYRDYMHHLMQRMVREGGMRQFYYDIAFASKIYHNLTGGHGYFLPDGRIQPEANDDELRAFALRSYAMMQENGIYPTGVSCHATNSFCLKALPFFDAVLDSEYPMEDSIDTFPSERMIAMSCPHSFGTGINHLQQMNTRWAALHDASPSGASTFRKQTFDHPRMKHWGITQPDVTFVPYWRNDACVRRLAPGLRVSLWTRPDRAILGVINYGPDKQGFEEARPLAVTLDLGGLGVPPGLDAERLRLSEIVPPEETPPLAELHIDPATGAVTGAAMPYHQIRFFALHWDAEPLAGAWTELVDAAARRRVLDWGIAGAAAAAVGAPESEAPVRVHHEAARVHAWTRPSTLLLRLENPTGEALQFGVELETRALGIHIDPETERWLRFYQLVNLHGADRAETIIAEDRDAMLAGAKPGRVEFDGYLGMLRAGLKPGQVAYVSVDRY
jgi:hypothetical protein